MKIDSRSTLKQQWRSDGPTVEIRIPIGPAQLLSPSFFFFPTSHLQADIPRHPEPWTRRRGSVRPQTYQQASKEFRTHEQSPAHGAMSTSVLLSTVLSATGPVPWVQGQQTAIQTSYASGACCGSDCSRNVLGDSRGAPHGLTTNPSL